MWILHPGNCGWALGRGPSVLWHHWLTRRYTTAFVTAQHLVEDLTDEEVNRVKEEHDRLEAEWIAHQDELKQVCAAVLEASATLRMRV